MTTLPVKQLPMQSKKLLIPPMGEVAHALSVGLEKNFVEVSVEVVDCPDLTKEPYFLAGSGLGGSPRLLEVGGPPFLLPVHDPTRIYDAKDLSKLIGLEESLIIGAGAGPWPYAGKNCEWIANLKLGKNNETDSQSRIAKMDDADKDYILEKVPQNETRFAMLANLFCCQGLPSKVIKVVCKKRSGRLNLITAMREALAERYGSEPVGLGGTFLIKTGKAKLHVMPAFSSTPIEREEQLQDWLKFFDFSSPLVAVGTLVSMDIPGFDLRVQHFHAFSNHNQGGHYHYDTTPDDVEYIGYFNLAEYVFRVDQPTNTHQFGRD